MSLWRQPMARGPGSEAQTPPAHGNFLNPNGILIPLSHMIVKSVFITVKDGESLDCFETV